MVNNQSNNPLRFVLSALMLLAILACQLTLPGAGTAPADSIPQAQPEQPSGLTSDEPAEPPSVQAQEPPGFRVDWFRQDMQDPQMVYYCLTISNPNGSQAQYSSSYQVTAYDASGSQLGERGGVTGLVFPGQNLPVAGVMYLDGNGQVDQLKVKAESPGRLIEFPGGKDNPLTVEGASLVMDGPPFYAVGTIRNNLDQTLTDIDVSALAYDENDRLVDAAIERLRFVPAGGQNAIMIYFRTSEKLARVELYPQPDSVQLYDPRANPLVVEKTGAQLSADGMVQTVFILQNRAERAYAGSTYIVSLYDNEGLPLAADSGEITFLPPGGRIAHISHIPFTEGAAVSRVDVNVLSRPEEDSANQEAAGLTGTLPIFEEAQYIPQVGVYAAKVTVLVNNPANHVIDGLGAAAVLYNDSGQIVGGGETSLGVLPAGAQAEIEMNVVAKGEVAQVEVLPIFYTTPPASVDSNEPLDPSDDVQGTAVLNATPPQVLSQWFAPNRSNPVVIDFAFLIENPNPTLDLNDLEYQAVAFDSAGMVLGSTSGYLDLPAAGRMGEVNTIIVQDGSTTARVEVGISNAGLPQESSGVTSLQMSEASYTQYESWGVVSGWATSSLYQEISGLTFNALVFDAGGQIIGSGSSHGEYFVPAKGATPLAVRVDPSGQVARAELYPVYTWSEISSLTLEGIQPLQVSTAGYAQSQQNPADVLVAFMVENPNPGQVIFGVNYTIALYDSANTLLATTTGGDMSPLPVAYTGGITAMIERLNVPDDAKVARAEVLLSQGQVKAGGPNPLQGDKPTYIAEPFPRVTGLVLNTGAEAIEGVYVVAVVFDKEGQIIGGGSNTLTEVPANGQVPVEILVSVTGDPAGLQIYPGVDASRIEP